MIFAITQVVMVFFCYIYLLEEIGMSPIAAGIFASNLQLAGLFAAGVGLDLRSSRTKRCRSHRHIHGLGPRLLCHVSMTRDWGAVPLLAVALACGVSGQAWNAVFTDAMGELVPPSGLPK